jgi:hypothetical protein
MWFAWIKQAREAATVSRSGTATLLDQTGIETTWNQFR